ncbi:hypothetical protein RvY_08865 [Ramazzottius varieornatus]|uniref:Uncharacterized protein n=1 Tax=Ramazzottius varieornatus TaxID=947166 RepID=A0A1D1VBY5_RAMVA|nr:hypothetical protein RvY_08865 [Ramazzottius varieornatus]
MPLADTAREYGIPSTLSSSPHQLRVRIPISARESEDRVKFSRTASLPADYSTSSYLPVRIPNFSCD